MKIKRDKAIICDIDGTLASRGKCDPHEHEKSGSDSLCDEVKNLLDIYKFNNYRIIILTGRQERFSKITKDWLAKHNVEYDIFHMRKNDDNRKDSLIKKNMYQKYIKNNFDVELILDDRDQVVEMWRKELGLKCFQVNYGNF